MRAPLLVLFVLSTGCATAVEALPAIGKALQTTKSGFEKADDALAKVTLVQSLVCSPAVVTPEAVNACSVAADVLEEADKGMSTAHDVINDADDIYTEINAAAQ